MEAVSRFADVWMPVFALHVAEMSLFIFLVWGVDRTFRLHTRLRYTLWLLALGKVFVPPVFSVPDALLPLSSPVSEAMPVVFFQAPAVVSPALVAVEEAVTPGLLVFGSWIASVLLFTGMVVWKNIAFRRHLSGAVPVTLPDALLEDPSALSRIHVLSVDTIQAPILFGFRQPRLFLPADWETWSKAQLKGILAHEQAHIRARDLWALAFETLAIILFGLNPLVWLLHQRLRSIRELRCDEAAIGEGGIQPVEYSRLLLAFIQKEVRRPVLAATGIYFSGKHRFGSVPVGHGV